MKLLAVDKTGRKRAYDPTFEELSSIKKIEFELLRPSDPIIIRNFSFLSENETDSAATIELVKSAANQREFNEKSILISDTDISAFEDARGNKVNFRKNEIIVGFSSKSTSPIEEMSLKYGLISIWFDKLGNFGLFRLSKYSLEEILERLQFDDRVLYAEPNVLDGGDLIEISDLESTGIDPTNQLLWNHLLLKREGRWLQNDGDGVVIALVDTPIALDHPGFLNSLCLKSHELHFGDKPPLPMSHGTGIASILVDSTVTRNGMPLGLCPSTKLLPISIDTDSLSSYAKRASAINYLANSNSNKEVVTSTSGRIPLTKLIVNCSWQVSGTQDLTSVALAFNELNASGAICVCSAGNNASDQKHYPSDYNGCISVASLTKEVKKSKFSNYSTSISFSMPGGDGYPLGIEDDIVVANRPNEFNFDSGTSVAAPHASALLAVIWSRNPTLNGKEVVDLAKASHSVSVEAQNPLYTGQLGSGLICF